MYCTNCGKQIDNFKYCPFCGNETLCIEETGNHVPYVPPNQNNNQRFGYRSSTVGFLVFQIILNFCLLIGSIVIIIASNSKKTVFYELPSDSKNVLLLVAVFFLILSFILSIVKIVKISAVTGTYLVLTDFDIYGVGGAESYLGKVSFKIPYRDIMDVYTRGGVLGHL